LGVGYALPDIELPRVFKRIKAEIAKKLADNMMSTHRND
jgi:hypothetical protein